MMYHFTGRRLALFGAGLLVLGILTYAAGVVTGIGLGMPTRQEIAMLKAAKPAGAGAAATAASVLHPPAIPAVALPAVAIPSVALPGAHPAPAAPASPAPGPAPAASPAAAPPQPAVAAAEPPAADAAKASQSQTAAAAANEGFSLQLGSFHDATHAKQLQTELKDRGYTTSIMTALDSEQREWHVVRIDGYKTLEAASKAAADFTGKERITALVRRTSGL